MKIIADMMVGVIFIMSITTGICLHTIIDLERELQQARIIEVSLINMPLKQLTEYRI